MAEKSCGNCANCDKVGDKWMCEEYGFYFNGIAPVDCTPPHDEACRLWTDDSAKANTWERMV